MTQMDSTLLREAREWLADLDLLNPDGTYMTDEDRAELTGWDVLRLVDRRYDGRIGAFIREVAHDGYVVDEYTNSRGEARARIIHPATMRIVAHDVRRAAAWQAMREMNAGEFTAATYTIEQRGGGVLA